jgi:hypothetical protein
VVANGVGSILCLGTSSIAAGLLYGEERIGRMLFFLFVVLFYLAVGFYLFIRALKVISPKRRVWSYAKATPETPPPPRTP